MRLAILLTGTVKPAVIGGSFSVEERMKMYEDTLRFYARTIGKKYPVVMVENSDVSLDVWNQEFKNSLDLEILQFRPDDPVASVGFDNSQGKGYNEYLMIKKAILTSEKLKECTHFLKITGRYAMENICDVIKEIERRVQGKVFFDDIKDTRLYDIIGRKNTDSGHWADSRFFVAEIAYYKENLMDIYKDMNDYNGRNAEACLFDLYKEHKHDARFLFRYKTQVQFDGSCGLVTDNFSESYNSPKARLKNKMRQLLRYMFPNIWF